MLIAADAVRCGTGSERAAILSVTASLPGVGGWKKEDGGAGALKKAEESTVEDDAVAGCCTGPPASPSGIELEVGCVRGLIPVGRSGIPVISGSRSNIESSTGGSCSPENTGSSSC